MSLGIWSQLRRCSKEEAEEGADVGYIHQVGRWVPFSQVPNRCLKATIYYILLFLQLSHTSGSSSLFCILLLLLLLHIPRHQHWTREEVPQAPCRRGHSWS